MRKRVVIFIIASLLLLSIVPAINLKSGNSPANGEKWNWSALYNIDFALPYIARFLYSFGISMDPDQVIIGKNGWLYLGDKYEKPITVKRRGATPEDVNAARKIGFATQSWEQWLKIKGVCQYQIMLVPDKDTIYPEFLPDWVNPAANSATDVLLANVREEIYIDTRPSLWKAKSQSLLPLYLKTDSHWNRLGAWVAFHAFSLKVADTEKGLRCISDTQLRRKVGEFRWGDLSNMLRLPGKIREIAIDVEIARNHPIGTELYDYESGNLTASGDTFILNKIGFPIHPVLVKTKQALNQKKVFWLFDSFGIAMIPFMTATFTESLLLSYDATDPDRFAKIVSNFKPDYVFITVVERKSRSQWFQNTPPNVVSSGISEDFFSHSSGIALAAARR